MKTIAIIAGEPSGDVLGRRLIEALSAGSLAGQIKLIGVGGEHMQKASKALGGFRSLFPMRDLTILGFFELLPHIPKVLYRLTQVKRLLTQAKPDLLITIDSPGFNNRVARWIKEEGLNIPILHWVAPSVWAYKPERAKRAAALYDHLMVLFPFEVPYFTKEGLKTDCTGHPVVQLLDDPRASIADITAQYQISKDQRVITLVPGSRKREVQLLLPLFLGALAQLLTTYQQPFQHVFIPTVPHLSSLIRKQCQPFQKAFPQVKLHFIEREQERLSCYQRSEMALVKSGTVTFELGLVGVPMVVAYKVHPISAHIMRKMIQTPYINLMNIMQQQAIIPECIQEHCTIDQIAKQAFDLMTQPERVAAYQHALDSIFADMGKGDAVTPAQKAAKIVEEYLA